MTILKQCFVLTIAILLLCFGIIDLQAEEVGPQKEQQGEIVVPTQSEPATAEPAKVEPAKAEPAKAESAKAESAETLPVKEESQKQKEPQKTEAVSNQEEMKAEESQKESTQQLEPAPVEVSASESSSEKEDKPLDAKEFSGVYKAGYAPFQPKTKVNISSYADSLVITPQRKKEGESSWNLSMSVLRGAVAVPEGIWIYWFGPEGSTTLNAYIQMSSDVPELVNLINAAIAEFNKKPMSEKDAELYRKRFEDYKKEALQKAQ